MAPAKTHLQLLQKLKKQIAILQQRDKKSRDKLNAALLKIKQMNEKRKLSSSGQVKKIEGKRIHTSKKSTPTS